MKPPNNGDHLSTVSRLAGDLSLHPDNLRYRAIYELTDTSMLIHDPVWDDEYLGEEPLDQILIDLAHTDALRRLQTIEQLTLPERYSTIPDSYFFSRWEHVWGSTIFVRRMARTMGLDAQESMYLQLKVLLSDFKHTAFSHAGDWLFQDEGGPETDHERRRDYADVVGITRLLKLHGFDANRIFDDDTHDITDKKQPALDGDRIDYTLRESFRWVDQSPVLREHLTAESFTVIDDKIVCKTPMAAKMLAVCHTLLVTEYWHDPVERLNLNLLLESLKRVFVCGNGNNDEWGSYSPRDLMTTADHTLIERLNQHDEFIHLLDDIMSSVANSEQTKHWRYRRDYVRETLESVVGPTPSAVPWVKEYYDILPTNVEVEEQRPGGQKQSGERVVVVPLPAHRSRYIDPDFIDEDGEVRKLSEEFPEFWEILQKMLEPTRKNWVALLTQNRVATEMLRRCFEQNQATWPEVMERPRLSSSAVRSLLRSTVQSSTPYAAKFIDFSIK